MVELWQIGLWGEGMSCDVVVEAHPPTVRSDATYAVIRWRGIVMDFDTYVM